MGCALLRRSPLQHQFDEVLGNLRVDFPFADTPSAFAFVEVLATIGRILEHGFAVNTIRIATRQSKLALWQANHVSSRLRDLGYDVTLVPVTTTGDRIQNRTLAEIGGKGLFIKELETAMLEDSADLAVHSMKDVPGELPEGFVLAAILEREDPRDVVVTRDGASLNQQVVGSRVGSSSLRRRYQVRAEHPTFEYLDIRGNVDTRLGKLRAGDFEAVVLAAAGMKRLELESEITEFLPVNVSVPAAGQGAVGIECRGDNSLLQEIVAALDHPPTVRCVLAERAFAKRLGAECNQPVGAFARAADRAGELELRGFVADAQGARHICRVTTGLIGLVADELADDFMAAGAGDLLLT